METGRGEFRLGMRSSPRSGVIRTVEVVHAVFYAPYYVALDLGVYGEEGIVVESITTTFGEGERYLRTLNADVLVAAQMRTMREFESSGERILSIAPVVVRHPFYLFGRKPTTSFTWTDLVGHSVIDFAEGQTPMLCLRYVLRQHGIAEDHVGVINGLQSAEAVAAFRAGRGDFLLHSLHTGQGILEERVARTAIPLAAEVGEIPFTSFAALPQVLRERAPELIRFKRAYGKALAWLAEHSAEEVASLLRSRFPDHDPKSLTDSISSYQASGIWPRSVEISAEAFVHFREILVATGWLKGSASYDALTWQAPYLRAGKSRREQP